MYLLVQLILPLTSQLCKPPTTCAFRTLHNAFRLRRIQTFDTNNNLNHPMSLSQATALLLMPLCLDGISTAIVGQGCFDLPFPFYCLVLQDQKLLRYPRQQSTCAGCIQQTFAPHSLSH
jgi:hypothetical protein